MNKPIIIATACLFTFASAVHADRVLLNSGSQICGTVEKRGGQGAWITNKAGKIWKNESEIHRIDQGSCSGSGDSNYGSRRDYDRGRGQKQYGNSQNNRYGNSQGNRYRKSQGNRYGNSQGNRYQKSQGNRYENSRGKSNVNRYSNSQGNRYGNSMSKPNVNRYSNSGNMQTMNRDRMNQNPAVNTNPSRKPVISGGKGLAKDFPDMVVGKKGKSYCGKIIQDNRFGVLLRTPRIKKNKYKNDFKFIKRRKIMEVRKGRSCF